MSFKEASTVQNPLIRYAEEAGWTCLPPDEALLLRQGESSPLLWETFVRRLQMLNPGRVDHLAAQEVGRRLMRVPLTIEGNLQAWEFLRGLKTVYVQAEKQERNLQLLDFEHVDGNTFHVTAEFSFTSGGRTIRPDIVFLVNGMPLIIIETKAATKLEGIADALDQIRRYHRDGPELLSLLQIYGLTHLVQFYYGATWNCESTNLFNWRHEQGGPSDFETLVKDFVAPQRVLRLVRDFILFTRKDDELKKTILRPHQMRAVERALRRARDPQRRRGLIWHTQGSGKTYTMITIAKRLMEEPVFQNPTVVMLVDRTELETQLFGNLSSTLLGQQAHPLTYPGRYTQLGSVYVADTIRGLRELLERDTRGLIVSMIHKFDQMPANVSKRQNIFVLVDEAHRTTGGDLGNYLMGALPNATYLGFTGTPIDKTAHGAGTFKVFGIDDPQGYLDKYSIAESIRDKATVPLYYALASNELLVDRQTLEKEFLNLAEAQGVSDIEDLNGILTKAVTLRSMLKNPERVQRVAAYVADHFKNTVEPLGYKAFLVGVDREACVLYKEALDKLLPPDYSKVVISPDANDDEVLRRHHLSDQAEKAIRKAFIKPDELPKILIVTEKLLTGYDAPVLYCMYLDKPMRDHVLLQAIARVNRPYADDRDIHKPGGFVVDFVGIFDNLEKALAFDSRDVQSVIQGLDVLKARFTERMALARELYLPLIAGKSNDKAAEAALEALRDQEERDKYYQFFDEVQDLYEIISPDAFLRAFMEDYQRLADLYALLRASEVTRPCSRDLARKTARLLQQETHTPLISAALAVCEITPETLERIAQSNEPDAVKVYNLVSSIVQKVREEGAMAPHLFSIGEMAAQIAEGFRDRQITTQEALRQLEELVAQINQAAQQQAERGISGAPFAVFWLLKQAGMAVERAEAVAKQMAEVFTRYAHWTSSDTQAREVRKALYSQLLKPEGVENPPETVDRIMTVLRQGHQ